MKLSCLQENLHRGLAVVGRAVAAKSTLPITSNILLASDDARLKLSATNLEIAITCWIGAKVEEEGAITVPARLLTDFVNSLPPDKIELDANVRSRALEVRCLRSQARINGLDAEDFPPIPTISDRPTAQIDPEALKEAISLVVFAAATDDSRPVLAGVHCKFADDQLTLAAADGFRLSVKKIALAGPVEEPVEVIVPAKTLLEVSRVLGDQEDPVQIVVTPNRSQVLFRLANVEIVSQLIAGTFPNYAQLIPETYAGRSILGANDFAKATRSASIFARDSNGIIRLQVTPGEDPTPGKMIVSARAEEVGDNVGEIDAIVEGEPPKIAFNAKYMNEVLGVLNGQIALETNTSSSPGVLRPVGSDDFVHVIMPMFVQW
ncbi:MAG TPA: DNA polymerase III subunit beta [Dehalococcoidia bacterium]|nr:DNA polymerase III subunit beta [Dehalococcoidia bacterium]